MKYKVQAFVLFPRPSLDRFWQDYPEEFDKFEDALEELWSQKAKGFKARIVDDQGTVVNEGNWLK